MRGFLAVIIALAASTAAAQPAPDARTAAAEQAAREAVADLTGDPELARYQSLAVIPRDGDASSMLADAMIAALQRAGRTAPGAAAVRDACARFNLPWAAAEPPSVRQIAEINGAVQAQGMILLRANFTPHEDGSVDIHAELTLADAAEIGQPWSVEVDVTATAPRRGSSSFWRDRPALVIGVIAALVFIWLISALRRRRA
jgi:hypothetical protein